MKAMLKCDCPDMLSLSNLHIKYIYIALAPRNIIPWIVDGQMYDQPAY